MFYDNVYGFFSRKIQDDLDMLKMAVESLKHKPKIEELFRRKEEIPVWALDIVRPFRKDSVILRDREFDLINRFIGSQNVKYTLLYRGSRDGMNSKVFHVRCDGKSPTVIICQSKQYDKIFGGVCFGKWSSPHQGQYVQDKKGFLFSLTH